MQLLYNPFRVRFPTLDTHFNYEISGTGRNFWE